MGLPSFFQMNTWVSLVLLISQSPVTSPASLSPSAVQAPPAGPRMPRSWIGVPSFFQRNGWLLPPMSEKPATCPDALIATAQLESVPRMPRSSSAVPLYFQTNAWVAPELKLVCPAICPESLMTSPPLELAPGPPRSRIPLPLFGQKYACETPSPLRYEYPVACPLELIVAP